MLALSLEGEDDMGDWWLSTATAPTDLHSRRFPLPNEVIHLALRLTASHCTSVHFCACTDTTHRSALRCTVLHRLNRIILPFLLYHRIQVSLQAANIIVYFDVFGHLFRRVTHPSLV